MEEFFWGRSVELYASGTAALARAIAECVAQKSVKNPEVILPAYGCPDVIAACLHSAAFPRLVDLAPGTWRYDSEALESSISANTIAVVAVNLLGVGDDAKELSSHCRRKGIPLIQDSAQHLPRDPVAWPGDYVVLSFGRGKPLNLLHGGALIRPPGSHVTLPTLSETYTWRDRILSTRMAALAFNALTRPHVYRAISGLPGTKLGDVTYHSLSNPHPLPERAWRQLGVAFEQYRRHPSYSRQVWNQLLESTLFGIEPLKCPGSVPHPEPLRLAVLAPDRRGRDELLGKLTQFGLGASRLYSTTLDRIPHIPAEARQQGPYPNAIALSDTLLTLPTHHFVTPKLVASACAALARGPRLRPP